MLVQTDDELLDTLLLILQTEAREMSLVKLELRNPWEVMVGAGMDKERDDENREAQDGWGCTAKTESIAENIACASKHRCIMYTKSH